MSAPRRSCGNGMNVPPALSITLTHAWGQGGNQWAVDGKWLMISCLWMTAASAR